MNFQGIGWGVKWDSSGSGQKHMAGSWEEPPDFIKCGVFLDSAC